MNKLRITEIFFSLQGETRTVGIPTVFIRLTGCPLRCGYCDTAYAFQGGEWLTIDTILQKVAGYQVRYVTVTGGEPLAQKSCIDLLTGLCDAGYQVSLETSGALDVSEVDHRVVKVIDIKTPGSKMEQKNYWPNLQLILPHDQIKFVICNQQDFLWSKEILEKHDLANKCEILFSPSYQQQPPAQLAEWILEHRLPVRMQIQLHKYLWGDVAGR